MAKLLFKNLEKIYPGGVKAVSDFSLEVEDEEFIIFIGPSGSGKSTVLRMIAGLEDISAGELYIDDKIVNDVEPKDRNIAMVFQDYALYPHMNVYDNMAFGLKMRKFPKKDIEERVLGAAKTLGIEDLLKRKPKALSGGQRQRVALGRAIVRDPKVFLMDEPLSNLDAKLRVQTRREIVKLHKSLRTTFIYVTHDQVEAMTMGDKIVVMKDGLIQQFGTPEQLYQEPVNMFVASFIGSPQMNLIDVELRRKESSFYLGNKDFDFKIRDQLGVSLEEKGYLDKELVLGIRPEDLLLGQANIEATIDMIENMGNEKYVYAKLPSTNLALKLEGSYQGQIGQEISLSFKEDKLHFFDKETKKAIR